MLCGKIAAGKSTLAKELASQPSTICIREDAWLAKLFPDEILTVEDYIRCSARLRDVMGTHVSTLLSAGISVVMDFPANTVGIRQWMRGLSDSAAVCHQLHYLEASDTLCKARLRKRNHDGDHEFAASEAEYEAITAHFAPPVAEEGLNVIRHIADKQTG